MEKLRLKYSKYGPIRFLGHLDIMRYFQKAIRRAHLDVKYSEGYHPHQLLSFAQPLSVGVTSDGEYLDMTVNSLSLLQEDQTELSLQDFRNALNHCMREGIQVTDIACLEEGSKNAMSEVSAASYTASFRPEYLPQMPWEDAFRKFLSAEEIIVTRHSKKKERTLDIKPYIYKAEVVEEKLQLLLSAGSEHNVKPELLLSAFLETIGQEYTPATFSLHRNELYRTIISEEETCLEPLIPDGTRIKLYGNRSHTAAT